MRVFNINIVVHVVVHVVVNVVVNIVVNVVINIVVNKDGSQSAASEGDDAQRWQQVAQRVRGIVLDEMGNQQRPGGLLYNR